MLYINEPNISTNINRARQFFATERESWRSNHISLCKVLQNRKSYSFYTFWPKKTHISRCKIVHLYIIATVTVHICTVTVVLVFNILIIFFSLLVSEFRLLSLFLSSFFFSPHSPFPHFVSRFHHFGHSPFPHLIKSFPSSNHATSIIKRSSLSLSLSLFLSQDRLWVGGDVGGIGFVGSWIVMGSWVAAHCGS